ncbi:hypothetical protein KCP75_24290 [Salmonella enterica subsp. enterica]|nr:hypothetical protein KCP75_24290 [Salmonella enterica subsp. enterica]
MSFSDRTSHAEQSIQRACALPMYSMRAAFIAARGALVDELSARLGWRSVWIASKARSPLTPLSRRPLRRTMSRASTRKTDRGINMRVVRRFSISLSSRNIMLLDYKGVEKRF